MTSETRRAWGILGVCFLYALLRYVVSGANPPRQIPAWVLNKALGFSAVGALGMALWARGRGRVQEAQRWSSLFGTQILIHIGLSLALFSQAYYPDLYQGPRMALNGECAVLGGVLAALAFLKAKETNRRWLLAGCAALLLHTGGLGIQTWFSPGHWPMAMPPISLLGFLGAVWGLVLGSRLPGN